MSEQAAAAWEELSRRFTAYSKQVDRIRSVNVNSATIREETRTLARFFFRSAMPLMTPLGLRDELDAISAAFQTLMHLSEGHNALSSYKKQVKRIRKVMPRVSGQIELLIGGSAIHIQSQDDQKIIDTLAGLVPSSALSYQQAIADLKDGGRVSFRGPALELREALREVEDYMAPDAAVEKSPGYQREEKRSGPTMRQKVRFILKTREQSRSSSASPEAAHAIDEIVGALTRSVYETMNVATHTATERAIVQRLKRHVDAVLHDLLEL